MIDSARLQDHLVGHVVTTMVGLGHRLGLLEALRPGPVSAGELAARAGVDPRWTREWLGALVAAGVVAHDGGRYALAGALEPLLTGTGAANLAPTADMLVRLTGLVPEVADAFAAGTGIPAREYAARAGDALGAPRRYLYDETLVDGFLAPVPGLLDTLRAGARVLDLGCGTGQVGRLVADAFPASTVVGLDVVDEVVARAEADRGGRTNLAYRVGDAGALAEEAAYDVVLAVDVIHDLGAPAAALAGIRRALAPGGVLVMVDVSASGDVDDAVGDPAATLAYGISVLHCLPVGLAGGGAGLGGMWGVPRARAMLAEAGFDDVTVLPSPRPQNAIHVAR